MAKITTVKKTIKLSASKNSSGTRPCNICHGTGRVPKTNKKK